jgi:hypothetical protein
MISGGVAELVFGVAAEQQSQEEIATPLSAVGNMSGGGITTGTRPGFARGGPHGSVYPQRKKR